MWGTLLPQKPKIERIRVARALADSSDRDATFVEYRAACVDVGSACVDIRPSPTTDVLVRKLIFWSWYFAESLGPFGGRWLRFIEPPELPEPPVAPPLKPGEPAVVVRVLRVSRIELYAAHDDGRTNGYQQALT